MIINKHYRNVRGTLRVPRTFNIILSCVFLWAGSACQSTPNAPIRQEKLINVLYDIHTAEGLLESESQNVRDSMAKIYYAQIFQKHGVTQIDFDSTMAIYTRNPTQMDTVYNHLLRIVKADRDTLAKH